ncbi:hypothetical protein, partial [Mycolicibacterium gadium]|uniref:hypothetical protein n=1 Tax=Mycolicibacterium gadium TaxID=1794 RepID=UPI0021F2F2C7
ALPDECVGQGGGGALGDADGARQVGEPDWAAAIHLEQDLGPDSGEQQSAIPTTSIQMAVAADPALNLALISVPGDYAAAEAMKALRLGLDVMVFRRNAPAR